MKRKYIIEIEFGEEADITSEQMKDYIRLGIDSIMDKECRDKWNHNQYEKVEIKEI